MGLPLKDYAIGERILYGLIKKHIAGTTMSSAIEKAKELNGKKLAVSIAFLSDSAADSAKARYATTTYLELIRRIGRMGLKASIQVPLSQIGLIVSDELAARNIGDILGTANKYGVFVWLEVQGKKQIPKFLREAKGLGYAVSVNDSDEYLSRNNTHIKALKILCTEGDGKAVNDVKDISKSLKSATDIVRNAVLQSVPEKALREFLKTSASKKTVIFEFQLGYSGKKLSSMVKKGVKASVYVPFGKDWKHYAVSRAPGKYARFLATRIIKEA
jgi:proline dehydrogenase